MNDEADAQVEIVAICGGHRSSLQQLVPQIPLTSGLSCLVSCPNVAGLAESLRLATGKDVVEVRSTTPLEGARIYVLPADREVAIIDQQLVTGPPEGHGAVDRLLRSVAEKVGIGCVTVILGGDGDDGALGIKTIKEHGGLVICQTVPNPEADDMAAVAAAGGFVDLVLPFEEIGPRIEELVRSRSINIAIPEDLKPQEPLASALRDILTLMRLRTGHDFSWYKRATLFRRIARRMQVCQTQTMQEYVAFVRDHPVELGALLRDFLISVTNFFRDPDTFEIVRQQILPRLFRNKTSSDQLRVWVAGCATGEEAYSLAMLLVEYADRLADPPQLQVFATDIDETALQDARVGLYPPAIETDVSQQRLARFFVRENDRYRVTQQLREMMLFSPHNVLRDPPFSRLDLVSCRNLLIYLNRDAQDRLLTTFHFALKPDGFLLLGSSESADGSHLFGMMDAKNRLYQRRGGVRAPSGDIVLTAPRWTSVHPPSPPVSDDRRPTSYGELHYRAIEQYAPPSVLINEELEVVHLSEHAGTFLTLQGGEPTRHILRLVHPLLRFELRGAIYAARQVDGGSDTRIVRFEEGGQTRVIELRVRNVELPELGRGTLLVLFDELDVTAAPVIVSDAKAEPVVRELEDELHRTRDQLRTTIEQYETGLEEQKASNEELHAINEELRSATEELETSKEELQSVNEELSTLNHELKDKIDEVTRINSDLQNLMSSTDIAVVFLDRALRIKRFTPRAHELFNIIPSDIGRPFAHVTHQLTVDDLPQLAQRVLADLRSMEREVSSTAGRRYLARFLPYRSLEDRIEGAVLTFVEITELKQAEEARERSEAELRVLEERLAFALRGAPVAVLALDAELGVTWAFMHGRELKSVGGEVPLSFLSPENAAKLRAVAQEVQQKRAPARVELDVIIETAPATYEFRIEPGRAESSRAALTAVGFDMTPSKLALRSLHETDRRKDEFLATLSHELRNPLTPLRVALDVVQMPNVDAAEVARAHEIMARELNALVRLVDDLLDLSRVTHGKVHLDIQPVALVRPLEAALESTRPAFDGAKHRVNVELPPAGTIVNGDIGRLTQVFTNLLGNAAKYTPDGGTIDLRVAVDVDHVRLVVRDTGVGIAPELLPQIFEIFVQSRDEQSRSRGGLGIGLNLVRKLVELHGGSVEAHSDGLGKGASFTVELPLRKTGS